VWNQLTITRATRRRSLIAVAVLVGGWEGDR